MQIVFLKPKIKVNVVCSRKKVKGAVLKISP